VIKSALIVLVTALVSAYLLGAGRRRAATNLESGQTTLTYSRGVRLSGWVLGVLPAIGVAALALFYSPPRTAGDRNAVLSLVLGFGGAGGYLIVESRRRLLLDAGGLTDTSPWSGGTTVPWNEIASVDYSRTFQCFVFRTTDGRKLRASALMVGIPDLIDSLSEHLQGEMFERAVANYRAGSRRAL